MTDEDIRRIAVAVCDELEERQRRAQEEAEAAREAEIQAICARLDALNEAERQEYLAKRACQSSAPIMVDGFGEMSTTSDGSSRLAGLPGE